MSALNLYHNLIVQGFKLSVSGDKLELVPASRLTDSQRTAIKKHKSELLLLLGTNSTKPQQRTANDSPPYSTNELLNYYEKPLFNHLLTCPYCHIEKAQYCINGYAMGSVYDALLLNREDAQAIRASLALRVDKALISGHRRYIPFSIENRDQS